MEVPGRKTEQLPDALTDTSEEVFKFKCDPCSMDGQQLPAAGFCIDCQHYLCDTCYRCHQRPLPCRHHVLQDKSEMPRKKNQTKDTCSEKCQRHGGKPLAYFCKFHDQVGCSACVAIYHMDCVDTIDIDDIAKGAEESIEFKEAIKKLNNMETRFDFNKCKKEANISTTEIYYTKVKQDIKSFRKQMNIFFDKLEDRIEEKALNMKDSHVKKINGISDTCVAAIKEIQSLRSHLETLSNSKHSSLLFIMLKKAKQEIKLLEDCLRKITQENRAKWYKFEPYQQIKDITSCIKDLGQLSVIKPEDMKATHVGDINVISLTDKSKDGITGMTILSDGQLVITDRSNNSVKLLDTEKMEITSQLEFPSAPWGITETKKSEVAVTFPESKVIQFMSVIAGELKSSHEICVKDNCYSIVFTEGQLAAVVIGSLGKASVEIMELNGAVIKTIPITIIHFLWRLRESFIAVNLDQKILYLSHQGCLQSLTKQGKILATYRHDGMNGICVDCVGTVYICDSESIHQVTSDCKEIQVLLELEDRKVELEDRKVGQHHVKRHRHLQQLPRHCPIAYQSPKDNIGKLFIGIEGSNVIKVYELE